MFQISKGREFQMIGAAIEKLRDLCLLVAPRFVTAIVFIVLTLLVGQQEERPACKTPATAISKGSSYGT